MLRKTHLLLVGFSLGILTVGCSTSRTLPEVTDEGDRTTFLLNYEIHHKTDPDWKGDCSVSMTDLGSGVVYTVPLSLRKNSVQIEAPAGKYKVGVLTCEGSEHWDLDNFGAPHVTVFPGKVNYLGKFVFEMTRVGKDNELKMLRGDRDETRKSLMEVAMHMSPHWWGRVVSAYTGGVIPSSYLEDEKNYQRGTKSHVIGPKAHLNNMNFDECEKAEFKTNPVPLGILSYEVAYDKNKLTEIKQTENKNSFSKSYIQCVEQELKNFKPGYDGKVDYKVRL